MWGELQTPENLKIPGKQKRILFLASVYENENLHCIARLF